MFVYIKTMVWWSEASVLFTFLVHWYRRCIKCLFTHCFFQERAFLGVATLKELVLKRPHGPEYTGGFLQALLEITLSNFEVVSYVGVLYASKLMYLFKARVQALHVVKKCYSKPELSAAIEVFMMQHHVL